MGGVFQQGTPGMQCTLAPVHMNPPPPTMLWNNYRIFAFSQDFSGKSHKYRIKIPSIL